MKKIIIGIVIVLIICAVGAGAYFLIKNQSGSSETKSSTSEEHNTEKEESKKITKITAVKEMVTDITGKYTNKVEFSFENENLTSCKYGFYGVENETIMNGLKEGIKQQGLEDRIELGENSFSYEINGEEYKKSLTDTKKEEAITRNNIVSQFKKLGYTVTIEGDDSFLSNEESNSENTANESQSDENTSVGISNDVVNKAVEEAEKKAKEYLNNEEVNKSIEEAEQKVNEYIQNNQETIDAAKKQAEQMRKQYGF